MESFGAVNRMIRRQGSIVPRPICELDQPRFRAKVALFVFRKADVLVYPVISLDQVTLLEREELNMHCIKFAHASSTSSEGGPNSL